MYINSARNMILSLATTVFLIGCGSGSSSSSSGGSTSGASGSGYLSDSRLAGVTYVCGSNTGVTDSEGKFEYTSDCSEVLFSIGGVYLGSIATSQISGDGILYPSDLLGLDRNNTFDPQLTNMLQFFQSLDDDNNPNNGINIDANTSSALNGSTLDLEDNATTLSDINSTIVGIGSTLVKKEYAIAHYEDTLRNDLNISVDTVAPAPAVITMIPSETYADSTSIRINGEVGAKIFIRGVYSNIDIDANNSAIIDVNTSDASDSYNISSIVLRDDSNASSDSIDASIFRPSQDTLDAREVAAIKTALGTTTDPRAFTYTQQWNSGDDYNISFSETPRAATTDDQNYSVTATVTKGSASDTVSFFETVAFSQFLRDIAEVAAIKTGLTSRAYTYAQQWNTGDDYNVTFSEAPRAATTETQVYNVTATVTKGSASDTVVFSETVLFSQSLRDITEVAAIKAGLNSRTYVYRQLWNTGNAYGVSFSEAKAATTENQTYNVTATVTKGSASDTAQFSETVLFSQVLRDIAEINAIKTALASSSDPRSYLYSQQWSSGNPYSISFSEAKRIATAIDQVYNVTITITKGTQVDTVVFSETVPTTNVNIVLGDGTTTLINDEYKDVFTVTNGGVFQKIGEESGFIGSAISLDTTLLSSTVSSSVDLLNYMINNSSLSGMSSISVNNSSDGSLVARYEIGSQGQNLYELLEGLLSSVNYSISNIDFSIYDDINNTIVDFYVEYSSVSNSYVIVSLSDKTLDLDSDITKVINKDSIVQVNETIVNEQESFTFDAVQSKGDFIFVMDDSGSMSGVQAAAIEAIERTFASATTKYNLDWKATVIGTEDRWNYDTFTDNPSENNISLLAGQLDDLTTGGGDEVGIKKAYGYLQDGSIVERNNSSSTIIYASDEYCHTNLSEIGLTNDDLSNSYFVQNGIRFNAILPVSHQNDNDLAYKMALATGGDIANLSNYDSGYDQMMDSAVRYAVSKSSSIKLAYPALASSITVYVDGTKETSWEYDPIEKAIVFAYSSKPNQDANISVTYSHLDYSSIVANAKTEFDALSDDAKRAYVNNSIDITYDPASPITPLADSDQTYDVAVTFSKIGYTATTTFEETVVKADYYVSSNTNWEGTTSFTSQNETSYNTETLEITILRDTTLSYALKSKNYDHLRVYVNNSKVNEIYRVDGNDAVDVLAGDIVKFEHYKNYASAVKDYNATVTAYNQVEFEGIVTDAKAEFDALANDAKRAYVNNLVDIVFDPVAPKQATDVDQTYDVTVTISKYGYVETTTYQETVYSVANTLEVVSATDWSQSGTSFASLNETAKSTTTLEITMKRDTTINFRLEEYYSDSLKVYKNSTLVESLYSDAESSIDVLTNDVIKFEHYKNYDCSAADYNATITIE